MSHNEEVSLGLGSVCLGVFRALSRLNVMTYLTTDRFSSVENCI